MVERQDSQVFGRRAEKHILILASGDRIRHMTLRPWMAAIAFSVLGVMSIGYLTATTYLVLRDDLIGATMARQARMQHEYEDRITALRAQVDRITSRQLLDQQVVETKVEKLLEQQMALSNRHGKIGTILERAENSGLDTSTDTPEAADAIDPEQHASAADSFKVLLKGDQAVKTRGMNLSMPGATLAYAPMRQSMADRADQLFSNVTLSLKTIEHDQLAHIENLTADAAERTQTIRSIVKNIGIKLPEKTAAIDMDQQETSDIGGPFVEPETAGRFEASLSELDLALDRLERVRAFARKLPFSNPAPGKAITSVFGNRVDPFFGKLAMHAGVDFREKLGGKVRATGAGKVIHAGPAGGYGNMVEIDHGHGITTRFGHLSRTLVSVGDTVNNDSVIGLAGSTGRSTGPHLHYEVRRNGAAIDPMRFLNAGLKLTKYLD